MFMGLLHGEISVSLGSEELLAGEMYTFQPHYYHTYNLPIKKAEVLSAYMKFKYDFKFYFDKDAKSKKRHFTILILCT